MKIFPFKLSGFSPVHVVFLRELNGQDELMAHDCSTICAIQLLNRVMVSPSGNNQRPVDAEKIVVTDRDFLLSGIYKYTFGSRIDSSVNCISCHALYDLNFSLDDFVTHIRERTNKDVTIDREGYYCGENNIRFRLPNGEDELGTLGLPPEDAAQYILKRCLASNPDASTEKIIEEMEASGPLLANDFKVQCPECGMEQKIHFDIQSYLLTALKNERKKINIEVHNIATTYGWSHQEILNLSRSERQIYSGLITLHS